MANEKLSALTASTGATDTDEFYINQSGSKKLTGLQLRTFTSSTVSTTPTLTGNATGTETTQLDVTITNYSATATYTISVQSGSYNRTGDTITWTLPTFTGVDDSHDMSVQATEPTELISAIATHTVSVTELTATPDQTILYENTTINATVFPTINNGGDGADNASTTDYTSVHTTYIAATGTISASSEDTGAVWKLLDGSTATDYYALVAVVDVDYALTTPAMFNKYTITSRGGVNNGNPEDWTYRGSNDNFVSDDNVLDTVVGASFGLTEKQTFTCVNGTEYSDYRLAITKTAGTGTTTQFVQMELIEAQDKATVDGNIIAVEDNASLETLVVEQDVADTDFVNATPTVDNTAINYTVSAGATTTSVTITGATTFVIGDTLLMNKTETTTVSEIDTTSITTDNGGDSYTFDLTAESFTNAPLLVSKDTASVSTSIVATGGADSFVARTVQSHTADDIGGSISSTYGLVGADITKSNGDLTVTRTIGGGDWVDQNCYGSSLISSDDVYWEFTRDNAFIATAGYVGVCVVNTKQDNKYFLAGGIAYNDDGNFSIDGVNNGLGATWASGDIIGIRYEYSTGDVEFYKNGASQGTKTMTAGANTAVYPAHVILGANEIVSIHTGTVTHQPANTSLYALSNAPTLITDVFDTDTRTGRDIKHKVDLADSGDIVSRISTVVQKLG